MTQDQFTIICILGLFATWILLPMIPAIIIYRIFPDTQVAASGPFSGLTVKASGAFAAYLIIFLGCVWFVRWGQSTIDDFEHPAWTVRAELELDDPNGQPLSTKNFDGLLARLSDSPRVTDQGMITMRVPGSSDMGWPQIRLELPGFGYTDVELSDEAVKVRDDRTKMLLLKDKLKIQGSANTPYSQATYATTSSGNYPAK